ncbi:hypothetical protein BOKEGFJH_00475 [Chlamydia avium]|uniref:Probable queuosine precursor transporter n=2 Tax=Chlamydia avium TaxID=1457141 RepID=W8JR58_9CHLA|nr:queuosine precursor transporter [Chlamydia avium]AHK63348.1 Putative integral membrane family protein [Chlamydia avium 10DC88]EPP36040.1 putative integral membrane family protein [Chlamydia psittaci 10_743_SC13]EPP38284.1 putative integral membrane family protein [Chlamydia avium]VVT42949.1 hypothetical protein BOKEGFJH_00475 [Chlamydia avium]
MNFPVHRDKRDKIIFPLSLCFSLFLILSNLIASSRLIVTPYFTIPGGLLLYPFTYVISNIVNEAFGATQTRLMVFYAFLGNLFALCVLKIFSIFPAASPEVSHAWHTIFDTSPIAFFSSFIAFIISQQLDITLFQLLKRCLPQFPPWLRNYFSSSLSQIIDTIIVDMGVIYIGMHYSFTQTLQIMTFSYLYKISSSTLLLPLFHLSIKRILNESKIKTR